MPQEPPLPDALKEIFRKLNELSKPSKPGDLPRRIELCQEALKMISRDVQPRLWGMLQDDLASSLVNTPLGPKAENIEEAIKHYNLALEVRTRSERADEWAITQHNLAGAYLQRIKEDRAGNIEEAIKRYNRALEVRTRAMCSKEWATTQLNLARAYYRRIREKRAENLEEALQHCKQALEVYAEEKSDRYWAQAKSTLGEIYLIRICESHMENIEEAIRNFGQALNVHTRENFPEDWATLQNNLTVAYTERSYGVRADNLEQAIRHGKDALEVRTQDTLPIHWAETQHNLGNAYRYRVHSDPAENFEQAIRHFQQALKVRSRDALPEQWAETQHSLGVAYLGRIHGEPVDNLKQAVEYFQHALNVYTRKAFPETWAQVQNNLGNAYLALASDERVRRSDRADNIEKAIEHYEQALKVRTQKALPKDWAETHKNLAGAYTKRIRGKAGDNIELAIGHLKQTLEVYTHEAFPQDWAGVQNNLAIAYSSRTQGEHNGNVKHAIDHYQQALEVYTLEALPDHRLRTARMLGNLAFEERCWELARDAYDKAFVAQDLLTQASFSRTGKQTELAEVQNLSARAAYVHVQLKQVEHAVNVMERGRAQLLRESLEHRRRDLEQLTALGFGHLYDEYRQATEQYGALQKTEKKSRVEGNWIFQMEQALKRVQAATDAIREKAGQEHPEYRYFMQALPFEEIQKQAREKPLVYLSATPAGGLALIVTGQEVCPVEFHDLKQASLQKQIWHPSDEEIDRINAHLRYGMITSEDIDAVKGGYFSTYALWNLTRYLTNTSDELKQKLSDAWQGTLDETAHWLWEVVMEKLVAALQPNGSVTLIPAGRLALLPLHAAWTEDLSTRTRRRYVLDELNVTYAPSAHALSQVSLAANQPLENLLVIDNPDGSLDAAKEEVRVVLNAFKKAAHLPGNKATLNTVKEAMQNANVLHFATHGNAGWQEENEARLKLADGYLTLPDIFDLHLRQARLAVLSACETGVPSLKLIDEMIGLPAGMMQAGVPGVVGSLWSVNDMSTALLMQRFYKFWRQDGKPPQEALRQAQIWLRDNLFRSPYHWAAFTYTGI